MAAIVEFKSLFASVTLQHVKEVVGPIAQSVEQRTFNPWVDGSSPSGPTDTLKLSMPALPLLIP